MVFLDPMGGWTFQSTSLQVFMQKFLIKVGRFSSKDAGGIKAISSRLSHTIPGEVSNYKSCTLAGCKKYRIDYLLASRQDAILLRLSTSGLKPLANGCDPFQDLIQFISFTI